MIRIGLVSGMFLLYGVCYLCAQDGDSIKGKQLEEVTVTRSLQQIVNRQSSLHLDVVEQRFLLEHFTGNLMQTLEQLPGIHSMDIGMGASKPMIRGMAFNRISVVENGIKQEGQQWGADHGLEIDPFDVERVIIRKGPASLLYGSDAMGGVIEIQKNPSPFDNGIHGEVTLLGKSVNGTLAASAMMGIKKNAWYHQLRFSEQHYGDYHIPTDTIVYLTQRLPVYAHKLKNTAGMERDISYYTEYKTGKYRNRFL